MEDYEWSGCPIEATKDANVELVPSLIMCDRSRSLHVIAVQIGISFGVVQTILTGILGMSKVSARWVLQRSKEEQA